MLQLAQDQSILSASLAAEKRQPVLHLSDIRLEIFAPAEHLTSVRYLWASRTVFKICATALCAVISHHTSGDLQLRSHVICRFASCRVAAIAL